MKVNMNDVIAISNELRKRSFFSFRQGPDRDKKKAKDCTHPSKVIILTDAIKLFKTTFAEKSGAINRIQEILKREWSESAADYIAVTQENIHLKNQLKDMIQQLKRSNKHNGAHYKKPKVPKKEVKQTTTPKVAVSDSVLDLIKSMK